MTDYRTERISEALREELSELVGYELTDPRVALASVTEVQVSPDKKHAFVRVSIPPDGDKKTTLAALEHAGNFLRKELALRLGLFRVPELHFETDIATDLGGRMEQLLKRVKKGRPRE